LFHRKDIFYGPTNIGDYNFGGLKDRDRDPAGFLKQVFSMKHGYMAAGFKILYGHNNLVLSALAMNREIKKIFLNRCAALHVFTSMEIARLSNEYQVLKDRDQYPAKDRRIRVDVDKFKTFVDIRRQNKARMLDLLGKHEYLALDYTDIVLQTDLFKTALGFIGVEEGVRLKANYKKQNPAKLQDRIVNYDELSSTLINTTYEKYLREEF
jgi:hypothetical protein